MNNLANEIINREENLLQTNLVQKPKSKIIPKMTADFEKTLTEQMNELLKQHKIVTNAILEIEENLQKCLLKIFMLQIQWI